MKITRLGHAALLVELGETRILIDPGSYSVDEAFALADLDAIIVTHQHADHADPARLPALLAASPTAVVLAENGARGALASLADRAAILRPGDEIRLGEVVVTGVGGRHAIIHPDLPAIGNVGVTVGATGSPTLFHPGDSYEATPATVDILALPVAAPWAKLSETVDFLRRVGTPTVIPIHDAGLSATGYPIYRRTIESLGGAGCDWLGATDALVLG